MTEDITTTELQPSTPAQKKMSRLEKFRYALLSRAIEARNGFAGVPSMEQKVDPLYAGQKLRQLAARRKQLDAEAVGPLQALETFFDSKALKALFEMPNYYWFWESVCAAIIVAGHRGARFPLSEDILKAGIEHLRKTLYSHINYNKSLHELSPLELCCRTAEGSIIICGHRRQQKLELNPLFEEDLSYFF